jgi:hypothetical protein
LTGVESVTLVGNQLTVVTCNGGVYHGTISDFAQPRNSLPGSSDQGKKYKNK